MRIGVGLSIPELATRRSGGFSPLSLFTGGATGFWFSSSDITSLFQDSAGTTPVTTNGQSVGKWNDLSGNGNNVIQATAGFRPLYTTTGPGITFDGSDDRLALAAGLAATSGTIAIRFKTADQQFPTLVAQPLISSADVAVANTWFEVGISANGQIYVECNNAGTISRYVGSTYLNRATDYTAIIVWDGTEYYIQVNGVEQNPLFAESFGTKGWFGSVTGADNVVIGGTITLSGLVRKFAGTIREVIVTSKVVTA